MQQIGRTGSAAADFSALQWQLDLRYFKMTDRHMVEILKPAVLDNIHAELHKLLDVPAERSRIGGDVILR